MTSPRYIRLAVLALALGGPAAAQLADPQALPEPRSPTVYIVSPADGAVVTNPVTIVFGLSGMGVAPAGVEMEGTGHHHLLVNTSPDSMAPGESLRSNDLILHSDGGETEITLEMPEGTHTLRLLMGDHNHVPHDPPVASKPFSITVE